MDRIQQGAAAALPGVTGAALRTATPADAAGLAEMLRLLSPASAFLRFLVGLGEPKPWLVRGLLATGPRRGAVLAVLPGDTVVGHACWSVGGPDGGSPGPGVCDIGVVVADGWQRQGLGSALMAAAATHAVAAGGTRLRLDIHPENRALLASLRRRLPTATPHFADGLVTFELPLADVSARGGRRPPSRGRGRSASGRAAGRCRA